MRSELKNILPFAQGIERLMHPFAEVVVHDLEKDHIVAIYNPYSRRVVGDESYMDRLNLDTSKDVIGPYEKVNWDGRKLKCISIVIRDGEGFAVGFLCINLDLSQFESFQGILSQFLATEELLSEEEQTIFKDDLYEQLNEFVQNYCREKQVSVEALSREEKQELVRILGERGAFGKKNAPVYIGRVLGISRATVYNYLKERG